MGKEFSSLSPFPQFKLFCFKVCSQVDIWNTVCNNIQTITYWNIKCEENKVFYMKLCFLANQMQTSCYHSIHFTFLFNFHCPQHQFQQFQHTWSNNPFGCLSVSVHGPRLKLNHSCNISVPHLLVGWQRCQIEAMKILRCDITKQCRPKYEANHI